MAHTLSRSLRQRAEGGAPLPTVFHTLENAGIRSRRGQVMMVAGAPNAGKSMFGLVAALKAKIPTLYISADSDEWTQITRTAASLSGSTMAEVEEAFEMGASDVYEEDLAKASHIHFSFDPSPTLEDIALDIEAFIEMWGTPPELLLVDNLMNVEADTGDEFGGMREIAKAMHHFARHYGCAVWLLHHCSEQTEFGSVDKCPPRRAIQGKVSQLPEVILTVAQDGEGHMLVCAVKNRNGPSYPKGDHPVALFVRPERMGIYEDSMSYLAAGRSW